MCQPPPRRTCMRMRIAYACREALYIAPPPSMYVSASSSMYVSAVLNMCPHTAVYVGLAYAGFTTVCGAHMCPHVCVCVSAYTATYYMCVRILLSMRGSYMCGSLLYAGLSCVYVSAYCYLLYLCPHTATYCVWGSYMCPYTAIYHIFVRILLCMWGSYMCGTLLSRGSHMCQHTCADVC